MPQPRQLSVNDSIFKEDTDNYRCLISNKSMANQSYMKLQIRLSGSGSKQFLFIGYAFCFFMFFNITACKSKTEKRYTPEFSKAGNNVQVLFMAVPSYKYAELFTPLAAFLNSHLKGIDIHIVANNSLTEFEKGLDSMKFDFAFVNPAEAVTYSGKGYNVCAKLSNDKDYRGLIIVRKDAGFKSVSELKNKTIGFTNPQGVAGTMLPLFYFRQQGINTETEIKKLFVGSVESILMNVYLGKCDAGAVWVTPWQMFKKSKPDIAAQLEVKWETPSLINIAFLVKKNVNPEIAQQVTKLLLSLQNTNEGKEVLNKIQLNDTFVPATSETYRPVKEFLQKYNRIVSERSE